MLLLSLETTCDETAAAVLDGEPGAGVPAVRSSVVASQHDLHARFAGVVPEIAARAHLRNLLPVIDEALARAGVNLDQVGAIAVATHPGLVGSLVVGLSAAKALALALGVPLVGFDHLEGHLYAGQLARPERSIYPCVGLVVSGGHTHLYRCAGPLESTLLGGTIDDAAGEAFDKVASLLGLGFPGGPAVERAAVGGNEHAFDLPRAFLHDERLDFSFSGLKTAVLYALRGPGGRAGGVAGPIAAAVVADMAASFQRAVAEILAAKCRQALRAAGLRTLVVGGGVAANARVRRALERMAGAEGAELIIPPGWLCTDNAALGGIAFAKLAAGEVSDLGIDVRAGLVRPGRGVT